MSETNGDRDRDINNVVEVHFTDDQSQGIGCVAGAVVLVASFVVTALIIIGMISTVRWLWLR